MADKQFMWAIEDQVGEGFILSTLSFHKRGAEEILLRIYQRETLDQLRQRGLKAERVQIVKAGDGQS